MLAAGQRPQSAEQQSHQPAPTSTNKTFQSSVFIEQTSPSKITNYKKENISNIFNQTDNHQQQQPRTLNNNKSSLFDQHQVQQTHHIRKSNSIISSVFTAGLPDSKDYQAKNSDSRAQDHGKNYLFGKSDFVEPKKRVQTQEYFEPKFTYQANQQRGKEFHGNYQANTSQQELGQFDNQMNIEQEQDLDAGQRKQLQNQSNIFGGQKLKVNGMSRLKEQLNQMQSNVQWNSSTAKSKMLSSQVFGEPKQSTIKQEDPVQLQKQQEFVKQKRVNPNLSEIFGQQDVYVKSKRDSILPEKQDQKKGYHAQRSSLDQHGYDHSAQLDSSQKITNKSLRYKHDIIAKSGKKK